MARRKKDKCVCVAGAPSWMTTFSDMCTLLLTFFVLLISMASFEEPGRVEAALESIRNALRPGGYRRALIGAVKEEANQPKELQPRDQIQPVMSALRTALAAHLSDDLVKMTKNRSEVRVQMDDRVLFKSGSAKLHPAAYGLLEDLGKALKEYPVQLAVEGHTDGSGAGAANWELSALRAVAMVDGFERLGGMKGQNLEARGFGANRPASPDPADSWNRRVELVIQASDLAAYDALQNLNELEREAHGP